MIHTPPLTFAALLQLKKIYHCSTLLYICGKILGCAYVVKFYTRALPDLHPQET